MCMSGVSCNSLLCNSQACILPLERYARACVLDAINPRLGYFINVESPRDRVLSTWYVLLSLRHGNSNDFLGIVHKVKHPNVDQRENFIVDYEVVVCKLFGYSEQ